MIFNLIFKVYVMHLYQTLYNICNCTIFALNFVNHQKTSILQNGDLYLK